MRTRFHFLALFMTTMFFMSAGQVCDSFKMTPYVLSRKTSLQVTDALRRLARMPPQPSCHQLQLEPSRHFSSLTRSEGIRLHMFYKIYVMLSREERV